MANEKVLHTRMRQKRVEASRWSTAQNLIPLDGELVIYKGRWNGSTSTTSIFVGDGKNKLSSLNPIGTYSHNKSELSWDGAVTVGRVGADAITVSLPKPLFVAGNATVSGQSRVALRFITGLTAQTIDIYNPSNANGIQYDSSNKAIKVDAPPTNHASEDGTYGIATNTIYGHVTLQQAEDCKTYTSDDTALTPAAVNKAITSNIFCATDSQYGVVKLGYTTSGKNYAIKKDGSNNLYANVPWNNYYHTPSFNSGLRIALGSGLDGLYVPAAESYRYGVVKPADVRSSSISSTTGETTSGRYYGVELDSGGTMFVNVPWTDTTYSTATSTTLGLVKTGYTTSATNRNYAVSLSSGKMYVNIPTASGAGYGVVKPANVRDSSISSITGETTSGRYYGVELDSGGKMFVNVPWTDTTYSTATSTTLGLVKTGYDTDAPDRKYAVELNYDNKMYVSIPQASSKAYGVVKMSYSNGTLSIAADNT